MLVISGQELNEHHWPYQVKHRNKLIAWAWRRWVSLLATAVAVPAILPGNRTRLLDRTEQCAQAQSLAGLSLSGAQRARAARASSRQRSHSVTWGFQNRTWLQR